MDLNEKIAARRKQLVDSQKKSYGSGANISSEEVSANQIPVIQDLEACTPQHRSTSEKIIEDSLSVQEKIANRHKELSEQEKKFRNDRVDRLKNSQKDKLSKLKNATKLIKQKGSNINTEAIIRVPLVSYCSFSIWLLVAMAIGLDDERFNGENAEMCSMVLLGIVALMVYFSIEERKNKLADEVLSTGDIRDFGIMENLKSTHPASYFNFPFTLLVAWALLSE